MPASPIHVYCADIGSMDTAKKHENHFGWAGRPSNPLNPNEQVWSSTQITDLVGHLCTSLKNDHKVALGFESPIWIPIHDNQLNLTHSRPNETRAWSAVAGANSLAIGIAQICWILAEITKAGDLPKPTLHWDSFQNDDYNLFLWEAYVTGKAKTDSHIGDAKAAVEAFISQKPFALPTPPSNLFSIIGAAILWAGYSQDLSLLHQETLRVAPPRK